ncbi:MAG: hypothetical protein IIY11_04900 [Clostridia bacterium]|nr:hypothetical protein [Clostridia bacterium]
MSRAFRSAPMGFNKKDVVKYIEELINEKDGIINQLKEENEAFSSKNEELESRCGMLTDERRFAFVQIDQYKSRYTEAEASLAEIKHKLEQAEAETAAVREEKILAEAESTKNLAECEMIRKYSEQLKAQKEELEAKNAELEAKTAELETRAAEFEENCSSLENEKAELSESVEAMAQQYSLLEEAKNDAEKRVSELEELRVSLEAKANSLELELSETEGEIDALDEHISELEAERDSLKTANLRILKLNSELEKKLAEAHASAPATIEKTEKAELPTGSQELLALFKSRVDDMSAELSSLAQAILDAEKREDSGAIADEDIDFLEQVSWDAAVRDLYPDRESRGVRFEDIALDEEPYEDESSVEDDGIPETHIELKGYPEPEKAEKTAPAPVRRPSGLRDMLDKLISIGERLM